MLEMIHGTFAALGLKLQVVVAGAIGAFVSLRFFEGLNTWERWTTFAGGWAMAAYLAALAHEYFELKSGGAEIGVALLIGLFGMSIVAALIKVIRDTDWTGMFKRRVGGGGDST